MQRERETPRQSVLANLVVYFGVKLLSSSHPTPYVRRYDDCDWLLSPPAYPSLPPFPSVPPTPVDKFFFFSNEQINRVRIKKRKIVMMIFERDLKTRHESPPWAPLPISRENYALYNLLFFSPAPIVLFLHLLLDILLLHIIIIVIIIRFLLLNMMAICLLGKKEKLRRKKTLSGNRVLLICFLLF